jgi:peptidoglycan hydrolase-like protein with peptidoglycan-binding domain
MVKRRVVDKEATTKEIEVPAVFETITRQVVDKPASVREIEVPAEYKTIKVTKVLEPARTEDVDIPAQYTTTTRQVKVADGRTEYRSILCETNATPSRIRELQVALKREGFDPGRQDGVINSKMMSAINAYQEAKKLPVDPYINLETVKALGVSPN